MSIIDAVINLNKYSMSSLLEWYFGGTKRARDGTEKMEIYDGFIEKPERLMYVYGDVPSHPEGTTLTVLSDGTLENKPERITSDNINDGESRGLIAYTFPQTISNEALEKVRNELGTESHLADKIAFLREDGTMALVQSWKVKANKGFYERFEVVDIEPSMQQARAEFEQSLKLLFNVESLPGEIIAVKGRSWNVNIDGLMRGTGASIIAQMNEDNTIFGDMIHSVNVTNNSYRTNVKKKGKQDSNKEFFLSPDVEYAVYKNSGWATLIVPTPWSQFCVGRKAVEPLS